MEKNTVFCKDDDTDSEKKSNDPTAEVINAKFLKTRQIILSGEINKELAEKITEVLDDSEADEVVENLLYVKGIGQSKALAVGAALELGRRRSNHLRAPIKKPEDIIPFVRNYAVSEKEHFLVVTLNGGHEIIQIHVVSLGIVNRTLIHPREVFSTAIKENAAAIIVCHNHPSGNCYPSEEDVLVTKNLLEVSVVMGIELLDHVIVSRESYYSFVENNLLFNQNEVDVPEKNEYEEEYRECGYEEDNYRENDYEECAAEMKKSVV